MNKNIYLFIFFFMLFNIINANVDICDSTGSIPVSQYKLGKPTNYNCQENTGFCADDGGYYICKNNKYIHELCICPNRYCIKKASFIECERKY